MAEDDFWRAYYRRVGDEREAHVGMGWLLVAFVALLLIVFAVALGIALGHG